VIAAIVIQSRGAPSSQPDHERALTAPH
jgi:hypothetical protein